eukprot:53270_1
MRDWNSYNNRMNIDFNLYSSLSDAMNNINRWRYCNYDDSVGAFRDCGKYVYVPHQWTDDKGRGIPARFSIYTPTNNYFHNYNCQNTFNFLCNCIQHINGSYICDEIPTNYPTINPTFYPSFNPTNHPTINPTYSPTILTIYPTITPTKSPNNYPTSDPTNDPTVHPTTNPIINPTTNPTIDPTSDPITDPTIEPTTKPTIISPTIDPTTNPTTNPTPNPTVNPTSDPIIDTTNFPTNIPTNFPTIIPTNFPTIIPTDFPTIIPTTFPTIIPTNNPTNNPTQYPTSYSIVNTRTVTSDIESNEVVAQNGGKQSGSMFNDLYLALIFIIFGLLCCCLCCVLCFWTQKRRATKRCKNDAVNLVNSNGPVNASPSAYSPKTSPIIDKNNDHISNVNIKVEPNDGNDELIPETTKMENLSTLSAITKLDKIWNDVEINENKNVDVNTDDT